MNNHFFQMSFLFIKCRTFIFKRILILMIIKEKALENHKSLLKTHLNTFVSNVFLTLKFLNFANLSLTKVIHFCIIQSMDASYIHDIKKQLYLKHNYNLGMKNGKIKKINQHRKVLNFGAFFLSLQLYPGYEMLTLDIILSKNIEGYAPLFDQVKLWMDMLLWVVALMLVQAIQAFRFNLVNLITKAKPFTTISTPIVARIPNEMFR